MQQTQGNKTNVKLIVYKKQAEFKENHSSRNESNYSSLNQ